MTLLKKEINERVAVLSVSDDFKILLMKFAVQLKISNATTVMVTAVCPLTMLLVHVTSCLFTLHAFYLV